MKKTLLIATLMLCTTLCFAGQVGEWTSHLAYNNVTEAVKLGNRIYALADGSLFSVDTDDESVTYHNKQTGLHGAAIVHIAGNQSVKHIAVFYDDGLIDLLDEEGNAYAVTDLLLKDMSDNKAPNSIFMQDEYAYCSMSFGIMVLNLKKKEIADVYYIGAEGKAANVLKTALMNDSIYAIAGNKLYSASLTDNLPDYNNWHSTAALPGQGALQDIAPYQNNLYLLRNGQLWARTGKGNWEQTGEDLTFELLCLNKDLFCVSPEGAYRLKDNKLTPIPLSFKASAFIPADGGLWIAAGEHGLAYYTQEGTSFYRPDGPAMNSPFRMTVAYGKLYVVPGGRWASQYGNPGCVMIYDGQQWTNISNGYIAAAAGGAAKDFMNVAVDPADHEHFFVTSYGMGLYEFRNNLLVRNYTMGNSPIATGAPGPSARSYVRTDGAMFDSEGNLWLLNTGSYGHSVHVITPDKMLAAQTADSAAWFCMNIRNSDGGKIVLFTPLEPFVDNRHSNLKWIPHARTQPGIILLDDNGTPTYDGDDAAVFHTEFTDQDNNTIRPEAIYCAVQDRDGTVWVGHKAGVFIIPESSDFMRSNACERIKIPRNDGTNLADYLLNGEQVNAIAVDGSNRKWIGTESSGLYLMSEDGVETVEHFTTDNSPLLSDRILYISINPVTGVVWVGTDVGLMSYQSDASDPMPDFSSAYAYPNPVREDYQGVITITGLMDETVVHILDSGGNLVCETYSNGGIAVWDGRNGAGKYVASGVYTALCNTADGKNHTAVKIMIMRR
ncbi:MAG: hypothetical protein II970_05000 [Paludibacteraceae bacterium]|nr:hypothetical protein [Paludibacteraceae bacterium]